MVYTDFKGKKLSMLGFGTMRLPTLSDGSIDEAELYKMTDFAIANGVNFFDTAAPYHEGLSEIAIGKALSKYSRESYYLATKYPGHQISDTYNPEEVFAEQLRKCGVEYFDFYLLHNVCESSMPVYLDKRWGIIDYFVKEKERGRIKHLGFSAHAKLDALREFLDAVGNKMEFCQIQLNWLDWTLQNAKEKAELLNSRNIPIWVMEPLRGGKLAKLSADSENTLKALRPDEEIPAWSFRFLQGIEGVKMILSGMSDISQMKDNIKTFEVSKPLSDAERETLFKISDGMKASIPCTSCRYCTESCPLGLNIPSLIETYNDIALDAKTIPVMWIQALPEEKQPTACLACGKCSAMCPQSIDIPAVMKDFSARLEKIPKWKDVCRKRAEAAARLKGGK